MKTTREMRERIWELATPPRDDYDRAVLMLLEDVELLLANASASSQLTRGKNAR